MRRAISSSFQSVSEQYRQGVIHTDNNTIFAGVLYLTPNAPLDSAVYFKAYNYLLPNFAKAFRVYVMSTMNISLPAPLKNFVDEHVAAAGYGTSSEYVRELIRRDQDRLHLRSLIIEGASSSVAGEADKQYFSDLRADINKRLAQHA